MRHGMAVSRPFDGIGWAMAEYHKGERRAAAKARRDAARRRDDERRERRAAKSAQRGA